MGNTGGLYSLGLSWGLRGIAAKLGVLPSDYVREPVAAVPSESGVLGAFALTRPLRQRLVRHAESLSDLGSGQPGVLVWVHFISLIPLGVVSGARGLFPRIPGAASSRFSGVAAALLAPVSALVLRCGVVNLLAGARDPSAGIPVTQPLF